MYFGQLRTLAEGTTGYVDGVGYDCFPEMSLTEAMNALPVACLECQREMILSTAAQNDALVEAATNAIVNGTELDTTALTEGAIQTIKDNIKKIFEKIRKFIQSIITKIGLSIRKLTSNGHQLWAKYKDSEMLKGKDFSKSDITIKGYKFTEAGVFSTAEPYMANPQKLLDEALASNTAYVAPSAFVERFTRGGDYTKDGAARKDAMKVVDALKNLDQKERAKVIVKKLTGIDTDGENWQTAVREKIYGEEVDLKCGEGNFTYDGLKAIFENDKALTKIEDDYKKLAGAFNDYETALTRDLDAFKDESDSSMPKEGDTTNHTAYKELVSSYYGEYIKAVSQMSGIITKVKSFNYDYEQARYVQGKKMLVKMLSWKPGKENSDSSDLDADLVLFDFDL